MKVVIIGTGNVAYALAEKISHAAEHKLLQIAGRNAMQAERIASHVNVPFTGTLDHLNRKADLYVVAVTDESLENIGEWLELDKKLIVHTAGSVGIDVLQKVSTNYGVLYPLQSLKRGIKVPDEIPLLVDGNSPDDLALIKDFALSISSKVEVADDLTRKKIHLAAVFVNNFSNHLYALAERYCEQEQLSFDLLKPLIVETAARLHSQSAERSQTGPALRNDQSTISKHETLLKNYPELRKIYEMMNKSIREFHAE